MKTLKKLYCVALMACLSLTAMAHNPVDTDGKKPSSTSDLLNGRMDCVEATAQIDMDINNVRARLLAGGDVWWDLDDGRYIVPKPAPGELEVSSIFAGGVWIGGYDPSGNLKLAGVTYRSTAGTDYYPGPLREDGTTEAELCADWDRFFKIDGVEILDHIRAWETARNMGIDYNCDSIPESVKKWPGQGNPDWSQFYDFPLPDQPLGDFFDVNDDNKYDPCDGDFPYIFIEGCTPDEQRKEDARIKAKELVPDQMIYWIYNDNGGPHFNSRATAIQMEVQVQAFAYATNDELNDMTFQRYRLINKAEQDIRDCYFAMWVDPDLGCPDDDFIGCAVDQSLMYVYNEDEVDGITGDACPVGGSSVNTYGSNVPILGVDYFRGPQGPKIFQRDEDGVVIDSSILLNPIPGTGQVDTLVELGMTSFTFHNRIDNTLGDPQQDIEYYRYMTGKWRDGTPFTYGGNGYNPGSTDTIAYAFPDPPNDADGWSMCTAQLPFDDRRTVQATGPLLLQPSAINELIIGVVWVPNIDYPCPSIDRLLSADVLAQNLFDACFNITDGPDAPDMTGLELDREIILVLSNDTIRSNNKFLEYAEADLRSNLVEGGDSLYRFEGYRIYQLADPGVTAAEYSDPTRAIEVAQVDLKNGITSINNWVSIPNPDPSIPAAFYPVEQVDGSDKGMQNTFQILNDAFASGTDTRLINHKPYYYSVVAYAYNNFKPFDQRDRTGQRTPYLEGRRNIEIYTYVPRPIVYDDLQSDYGFGPIITRISGQGSGGINLKISEEQREAMIDPNFDGRITYNIGAAPIDVKIFDPFSIKNDQYSLVIEGNMDGSTCSFGDEASWVLTNVRTGDKFYSETPLGILNEQIIYGEGFSVTVNQVAEPGSGVDFCVDNPLVPTVANNGAVAQEATYADPIDSNAWYSIMPLNIPGFQQLTGLATNNYLINGSNKDETGGSLLLADPDGEFFSLGDNLFQPFYIMSTEDDAIISPAPHDYNLPTFQREEYCANRRLDTVKLSDLNNVDVVFTSDKSKWSRCVVVEGHNTDTGNEAIGDVDQFELRKSPSVGKDGKEDGSGTGMGWFPGYVVDVETGQRLNIFFAENSASSSPSGRDMIWNPTDSIYNLNGTPSTINEVVLAAGNHYVYVTRTEYDECARYREVLDDSPNRGKIDEVLSQITWASFPRLLGGKSLLSVEEGLIPNDLTVSLRVNNPFGLETYVDQEHSNECLAYEGNPTYEFSFENVAPLDLAQDNYADALANVLIVPNPYYAYSDYEGSSFDNTVKVTNLPARAVVTIYTLDGKFIRQFDRAETAPVISGNNVPRATGQIFPDLEWDMNNFAGVPVASGVYIFHIEAPELGEERSIKWFGVKRRFDPTGL